MSSHIKITSVNRPEDIQNEDIIQNKPIINAYFLNEKDPVLILFTGFTGFAGLMPKDNKGHEYNFLFRENDEIKEFTIREADLEFKEGGIVVGRDRSKLTSYSSKSSDIDERNAFLKKEKILIIAGL